MGNESGPSNTVPVSTVGVETFYYRSGTITTNTNWGSNPNGTGTAPTNFTTNGYYFNTRIDHSTSNLLIVPGSASKVIIPDDTDLIFSNSGGVQGIVEIRDGGSMTIPNNVLTTFGQLSETSTVRYTSTAVQQVRLASYGNLVLSGSGSSKVFQAGTTIIRGNLTVGAPVIATLAPTARLPLIIVVPP